MYLSHLVLAIVSAVLHSQISYKSFETDDKVKKRIYAVS